ncbi:MAG: HPr(Ser) kinase/phosphatase [Kiritimatiellae bacterium]|nr:HPr(Ser) kinase/phosphatase [Kiritimatiellia bacterium]
MSKHLNEISVSIREFFEAGQDPLKLEVEVGEAFLDNIIGEATLNRPGLALAGFFQYFAHDRLQVLGLAELAYLKSLPSEECSKRIEQFFKKHIPGVIIARHRHALPDLKKFAEQYKVPIIRSPMITMHFINAGTLILEDLISPRMHAHGTMLDILGIGVLIEGEPGIGKSETALSLIGRGHSLVSDDVTVLQRTNSGEIIGSAVEITRYHMEIRGLGLIHVPSLYGVASMRDSKRLDLIIRLVHAGPKHKMDRTGLSPKKKNVLGIDMPYLTLPVAPGRDMGQVVQVAALNQRLKKLGHDAAKELDEKLVRNLARRGCE